MVTASVNVDMECEVTANKRVDKCVGNLLTPPAFCIGMLNKFIQYAVTVQRCDVVQLPKLYISWSRLKQNLRQDK